MRKKRWPWVVAVTGIVGAIAVAVMVAWLLLKPSAMSDERAQIAAVQAVAAIGFGVGGVGTLMLFVRRQWLQEQAHELDRERVVLDQQVAADNRKEADRQHERELTKAADERHDATERRITELYMTAAEQLGHDKAPVRLAALHALDRLGHNDANHRQVIVDIWCSYLRQPFTPPARFTSPPDTANEAEPEVADDEDRPGPAPEAGIDPADLEYEVRATAQRLLASHLKDPRTETDRTDEPPPVEPDGFWGVSRIDLTGATLINTDFTGSWLPESSFTNTRFHGAALFTDTRFGGEAQFTEAWFGSGAWFNKTQFSGEAQFDNAWFGSGAWFNKARFSEDARFDEARFDGYAGFRGAQFDRSAGFDYVHFSVDAGFRGAQFSGRVWFEGAQFGREAGFIEAQFGGDAGFEGAQFSGDAGFAKARFGGKAGFEGAQFDRPIWFLKAQFSGNAEFRGARFGGDARFDEVVAVLAPGEKRSHVWPPGWVLEPDPEGEPDWGRLVLVTEPTIADPHLESSPRAGVVDRRSGPGDL